MDYTDALRKSDDEEDWNQMDVTKMDEAKSSSNNYDCYLPPPQHQPLMSRFVHDPVNVAMSTLAKVSQIVNEGGISKVFSDNRPYLPEVYYNIYQTTNHSLSSTSTAQHSNNSSPNHQNAQSSSNHPSSHQNLSSQTLCGFSSQSDTTNFSAFPGSAAPAITLMPQGCRYNNFNSGVTADDFDYYTCEYVPSLSEIRCGKPHQRLDPLDDQEFEILCQEADIPKILKRVFDGGIANNKIRRRLWPLIIGLTDDLEPVDWSEKENIFRIYERQWTSILPDQEARFTPFKERKSIIERDVIRCDRTHPFYTNGENVEKLRQVLMTYVMHDFDTGYVQGMSDLAGPHLFVWEADVVKTFWSFSSIMNLIKKNFDFNQKHLHLQLKTLFKLIQITDPAFADYLRKKDSDNCYFAFRWIICLFKREFMKSKNCGYDDCLIIWDTIWSLNALTKWSPEFGGNPNYGSTKSCNRNSNNDNRSNDISATAANNLNKDGSNPSTKSSFGPNDNLKAVHTIAPVDTIIATTTNSTYVTSTSTSNSKSKSTTVSTAAAVASVPILVTTLSTTGQSTSVNNEDDDYCENDANQNSNNSFSKMNEKAKTEANVSENRKSLTVDGAKLSTVKASSENHPTSAKAISPKASASSSVSTETTGDKNTLDTVELFCLCICLAIIRTERDTIMCRNFESSLILKHFNTLKLNQDLKDILSSAINTWNWLKYEGGEKELYKADGPVTTAEGFEILNYSDVW